MEELRPKILLIEDDANLVLILSKFIKSIRFDVHSSYTGKMGKDMALTNKYQLFIIDIKLPDTKGFQLIDEIRDISNKPIIVITGDQSEDNEINTYKYKANVFHKKPIKYDILEAQIKSLISLRKTGNIINSLNIFIDIDKRIFKINDEEIYLTSTEFNFILLLLNSNGRVFTRKQIISNVMNYYSVNSDSCVDTMVSRIRKKLINRNDYSLIKTINKFGYTINSNYLKNITREFS